ncbi:hypothetical protein GMOD_00009125 [Pyrenophora seminiperda CCB06]|uniref:6-phosphogluconate dehydrogenase C-terminal domain-like protein n=1 Tax=Pyrenophora seminiperda CCB06 TaxID=1302712 RepID=A0A3M7MB90_9PLEO|nr:hypothetical protein GMOD_00009125 [Pyrenophora seminiperda CCB06]
MPTPAPEKTRTVAILSIGQMGLGIAQLLLANEYHVITNISGRSAATKARAEAAGIQLCATDEEVVVRANYLLSIVPPCDAMPTAKRIRNALQTSKRGDDEPPLWYLELNAISPETAKSIGDLFLENPQVHFIDGGIIGGPPKQDETTGCWYRPGIPLSGPYSLESAKTEKDGNMQDAGLAFVLNTRYLSPETGTASGLKCCFAALTKGFTALALQSFTTASSLGVLGPLKEYMDEYNPNARQKAERGIVGCTEKAYRWVEEMKQIGECFGTPGPWGDEAAVFREIAGVFQGLADVVEKQGTEGMKDAESVVSILSKELHPQPQPQPQPQP